MPRALILPLILSFFLLAPSARAQGDGAQDQPTQDPAQDQPSQDEPSVGPGEGPPAEVPPPGLLDGLTAQAIGDSLQHTPLGSLEPADGQPMEIEFSRYGTGIESLKLTNYFTSVADKEHVELQRFETNGQIALPPLALEAVVINGTRVPLMGVGEQQPDGGFLERKMWQELEPGRFRARIVNHADAPILEIERSFSMVSGSQTLSVSQTVRNLTDQPLRVSLVTYGPIDLDRLSNYSGDRRRVRYGYLLDPALDPNQTVHADESLMARNAGAFLGKKDKQTRRYEQARQFWPNKRAIDQNLRLSWIAFSNRYFAAAIYPPEGVKQLEVAQRVDRVVANEMSSSGALSNSPIALRMHSREVALAPAGSAGDSASVDFRAYFGPQSKRVIAGESGASALAMEELVVYNFGGPCALCTFQWLTAPLTALLNFLHEYVVFDWALAIMLLVVIVRSILHPITKWSQIRMQRFAKQMQAMAPKQKALQERYADDRKKLQQEMARLWREEGVSPTGMLGCLPMLLQSPIWIALYASLFYNFHLRHEHAFFGLFQSFNGWAFLSDLSEPDRFVYLPNIINFNVPLMGTINSLNVLPLLLGAVFYVHQKYLTPPPSASMTPEQEQQQKIIRVMMVVMFPIIMYNAPSGLALYFITNSTLGIIESRWIRSHVEKHDLLNVDKYKAAKRKPSLGKRIQKRIANYQRAKAMAKFEADMPKPGMRQQSTKKQQPQRRYKKR